MTIKLIALDIDGTVVDSDNNISPANEKAIKEVLSKGIQIAFVTGRHREGTKKVMSTVGLDMEKALLVLNNGALAYVGEDIVWKDFLSEDEADEVIRFTTRIPGVATTIFQPNHIQLHCNLPLNRDWLIDRLKAFEMNCKVADNPDELTREDVAKIMLITESGEKAHEVFQMWPKQLSHLSCTHSYSYLCEINSSTCNKGRGLKVLCEKLGILPEEVLAVGDGENDVSMLTFAQYAVFVRRDDYLPSLSSHVIVAPKEYRNEGVAWAISQMMQKGYLR